MASRTEEIARQNEQRKVLVNSEAVREHLQARRIKGSRLELVYNGVDTERFDNSEDRASLRSNFRIRKDAHVATLVANLRHEVKNIPMFLRAAEQVSSKTDDAVFVIAGEGELRQELESLADSLGITEQVLFIGRCDDVPGLLAASDVCCLTSSAEGFSNSILEYMAASRPVVATDVGGAAEAIVEGETGFLIDAADAAALAERILELFNDPDRATALGRAGRTRVEEKFSLDKQVTATLELYQGLLG